MHSLKRHALVAYSAQQMFELVDDVDHYADFLPWCHNASVHCREGDELEASIEVASMGVHKSFTTRNRSHKYSRIDIELVDGPFETLQGYWHFQGLGDEGCRVTLNLDYEYSGAFAHLAFGPVFSHIVNHLVDAFCKRAKDIYAN